MTTASDTEEFYRSLPESPGFGGAFDSAFYRPVPEDWIVAATDVTDSTTAIVEGHYKDVTIAGAVGAIALANHLGSLDFPFFFGGDGMIFLLPGRHADAALSLLGETMNTVLQASGLHLRAGIVPVSSLYQHGAILEIGRVRVSQRYVQAVARGDGMARVDTMLKSADAQNMTFASREGNSVKADYRGFSCRWQDIPSRRGETISLIVSVNPEQGDETVLRQVQKRINDALEDPHGAHPLTMEAQRTRGSGLGTLAEARVISGRQRGARYLIRRLIISMEVLLVRFAVWSGLPVRAMGKRLDETPQDNIRNSDVQKLDGTLKQVLSVTRDERERIVAELDRMQQRKLIFFGYHLSDRAVMTCLIHLNHVDEVHFVDAADGGYAMAARMLKDRVLKSLEL